MGFLQPKHINKGVVHCTTSVFLKQAERRPRVEKAQPGAKICAQMRGTYLHVMIMEEFA